MQAVTRAVARPYGWIFVIPLANHTSYGYVHNAETNNQTEVAEDFNQFLRSENVPMLDKKRFLRFPCFMDKQFFDGRVFKLGNRASFLEPLEATAIGMILREIQIVARWISGDYDLEEENVPDRERIDRINREFAHLLQGISLFVSWHSANGSSYDTPFWRDARRRFMQARRRLRGAPVLSAFDGMVLAAADIKLSYQPTPDYSDFLQPEVKSLPEDLGRVGGFSINQFRQVGEGIGYFSLLAG